MKTKKLILVMLAAQLFIGCCDTNTYEVTISGLESRALTFDGIYPIDIDQQNPINKEDLVIELRISELEYLTSNGENKKQKTDVKIYKAAVVPCGDHEFIYMNTIESITVEILNSNTNERIDVTNQLLLLNSNEFISEHIPENSPGSRNFLMQFSDTSTLPNKMEYFIEATLDDGTKISSTGGVINFN